MQIGADKTLSAFICFICGFFFGLASVSFPSPRLRGSTMTTERIIFWTYVVLGPVAWVLFAYLISVSRSRMIRLRRSRAVLPADPPRVSILVPAKDEGSHIRTCVERVLQQDYPAFEVIAVNDRSADDTGPILDDLARVQSNDREDAGAKALRVVHIRELPGGWLGKCHALHEGAGHAQGEWLFFVDSDVKLQPEALSKMLALAIERGYDAVSIMTAVETERFIERLMLPLLASTWMTMFAGTMTNEDSKPTKAVANGQVFLIRKAVYDKVGGHAAVRDRIVEDVELMRLMKQQGAKVRLFAGRHLASTRMHTHWRQMLHGWARIFAGTSRGRIGPMVLAILFLLANVLSVYPILIAAAALGAMEWLTAAAVHWIVMTACLSLVWVWSGNSPVYALLLPISVPLEIGILGFSVRRALSGKINWRGAQLSLRETA